MTKKEWNNLKVGNIIVTTEKISNWFRGQGNIRFEIINPIQKDNGIAYKVIGLDMYTVCGMPIEDGTDILNPGFEHWYTLIEFEPYSRIANIEI